MTTQHPLRLSHTSLELLHTCERKFQLEKLLISEVERGESAHLIFGKAWGAGVQSYLVHQDRDRAIFDCWLAYWPEEEIEGKKSEARALIALMRSFLALDTLLLEYELVSFQDKPAIELSFRLDIDEGYYFVGYIDAVLRNRFSGTYVVFEAKTTGLNLLDTSPLYKNSGQALGYSIALDQIVGQEVSDYGVLYFVCQLGKDLDQAKIYPLVFDKTLLDRFNWFLTLGLDVKHLKEMAELNVYPKRGDSCLQFMRPCPHFGICHLHAFDRLKKIEKDEIEYQFTYQLDDVITNHLQRMSK